MYHKMPKMYIHTYVIHVNKNVVWKLVGVGTHDTTPVFNVCGSRI